MKIDTSKPVYFYDDRSKDKRILSMTKVLYEDTYVCLCETGIGTVLFSKTGGEVLTSNLDCWYATNKANIDQQ